MTLLCSSSLFPSSLASAAAHVLSIGNNINRAEYYYSSSSSSRVGNHRRPAGIGAGCAPAGTGRRRSLKQTAAISPSNKNIEADHHEINIARPLANFHPTVWGGFFISKSSDQNQIDDHAVLLQVQQRVDTLKEQVRRMFSGSSSIILEEEEMELVDALQRLGLAYHFEKEISDALARIHASSHSHYSTADSEDLRVVSLRFRLLRRGGYNVSSDEFNMFKDVQGNFKGSLMSSDDVQALLSLYEASYLGTLHEDGILEEAMSFCKRELESMLDRLQPPLAAEVVRALDMPLVRRTQRLEAREYLSFYEATEGRNGVILELAKLDFNRLQALYQEEVRGLTRWWKELGLIEKLSFARDRLVESYFWILAVCCEPHLTHVRMMTTKAAILVSVLDDIYDSYGTLEELRLLTDVMQRWDIGEAEGLLMPDYMKTYFLALFDTIKEFELKSHPVQYLKEEFKAQSKVYLKEVEWCNEGYTPTLQEHLQVSLASSAVRLVTCGFFVSMGGDNIATQEYTFEWFASNPKIVEASCMIGRLINDMVAHEFEENRQHVTSTVRCYMKEYGVSKAMAHQMLREMVDTAWKVMNEEWIQPTQIPTQIRSIPFEFARSMEIYYKSGDGYTHSSAATKDLITSLLVERIPL